MVRDLLRIQGLVITRNYDEAEHNLEKFQKSYPNVAASYVLSADLYSARGDLEKAHSYLQRAYSIDKDDPVIPMMMERLKMKAGR